MTGTGQAMGTADYMAPEQASDSRTVDIRADIYSLGCTFYKLLTGRAPFSGAEYRTTLDKLNAHVQQPAPPIRQIVPEVPEQLAAVLNRMLAKDPSERFATPAEVGEAIAPFCAGADLVALLKRAESSPPLSLGEGNNLPSPSGRQAGSEDDILPSLSGRGAGGEGRRWKRFAGQLVLLALVGGICFALGIILRIHKDGKETTVELPEGSQAIVGSNGKIDINLPADFGATAATETLATRFRMEPITRGDLTLKIGATGTIEPEEVVNVAAQVEGPIVIFGDDPRGKTDPNYKNKMVDYNTPVDVGAVLAVIDPTVYRTRRDEAAADLDHAKAEVAAAEARAIQAKFALRSGAKDPAAEAALAAAKAAVTKPTIALDLAQTNLDRTVIRSPVKGTIIDRRVNIGQNVLPGSGSLFLIAKDSDKLQIWVSVNEADIGRIAKGMDARFRVDTLPEDVFSGKVAQIRLNATMNQNVVYYTIVVAIDKPDRRLMPYMTANVSFQVETRRNVLRVPNAALRWKPRPEQIVPEARTLLFTRKGRSGWLFALAEDGRHVRPVKVEVELTDGTLSVVSGAGVKEGMEVVTGELVSGAEANPFIPKPSTISEQNPGSARGDTHAAAPPTVRITQPVVCNVCDYEEYTGRIEKGFVDIRLPYQEASKWVPADLPRGMTVREGDVLGEYVPYKDQDARLQKAVDALDSAEEACRSAEGKNDAASIAKAEAALKPARAELNHITRDMPCVTVAAPTSGARPPWAADLGRKERVKVTSPASGLLVFFTPGGPEYTAYPRANDRHLIYNAIVPSDSIIVSFDAPESVVLAHHRMPNRKPNWELSLPVVVALADDKGFPYRGKVVSVAEGIDPKTHTQRWQAVVPNKDGIFMPGMSVRVRLITSEPHKVMLIHNSFYWSEGNQSVVGVVDDRNVIQAREIKTGKRYDDFISVVEGLNASDWFIPASRENDSFQAMFPTAERAVGKTVKPEKITTPPLPWAAISVPTAVSVARPVGREVSDYADYTGRIDKGVEINVKAPITGTVQCHFNPEKSIRQGDLLADMLSEADAQKLAKAQQAVDSRNVPQSTKDQKQLAQAEDQLKKARAELDAAKRTVKYIKILAPCSGKIGSYFSRYKYELQVSADVQLFSIISYDSIYAVFDVDERTVIQLRRRMADRLPNWELSRTVLCGLSGDAGFPLRGKVTSVDSEIDPKTGTQHWHVLLPNKDGVLLPGMFVRVRLLTGDPHKALLVPERAVGSDQGRKFALVVGDQNVAERRDVEVGQVQDDGLRVVSKGLSGDDRVILDPSKATAGMTVKPENAAPPDAPPPK